MNLILFISLLVSLISQQQYYNIQATINFEFQTSNQDLYLFGFKDFSDDRDQGVIACFSENRLAYFADNYHNNIKTVDLNTGQLKVSNKISPWIEDLAVLNNKLYLLYKEQKMLILDNNSLYVLDSIELPKGSKFFVKFGDETLVANTSIQKYEDSLNKIECYNLLIENNKNFTKIYLPKSEIKTRIGYTNTTQLIDEKEYLFYEDSYYEINANIKPDAENGFYNIFIDGNTLLSYKQDKEKFQVSLLNY